jgi:hypothetical protein
LRAVLLSRELFDGRQFALGRQWQLTGWKRL